MLLKDNIQRLLLLVYTKPVNSFFHEFWLATQSRNTQAFMKRVYSTCSGLFFKNLLIAWYIFSMETNNKEKTETSGDGQIVKIYAH